MFPLKTVYLNFFHNLWWARPKSRNGESFPERLKSHQTELVSLPPSLLPSTPSPSRKANCPTVRCDVARLLRMQCTVQQIFHCTAMHWAALGLLRCICSQCHALCTVCTVHSVHCALYNVNCVLCTVHSLQSALLIHSVRHRQQQKMFALRRGGCKLIGSLLQLDLLLKIWKAWAIAPLRMREGGNISMAIYISVSYTQSPVAPKFPISAWPYWPPGAVTQ